MSEESKIISSYFETSIDFTLRWESEKTYNKDGSIRDKFGVELKYHPEAIRDDFSKRDAKEIYRREYWNKLKCDKLLYPINLLVFDFCVTSWRDGIKCLQRSLNKANNLKFFLEIDGIIGPNTLNAFNYYLSGRHDNALQHLSNLMILDRIFYYLQICNKREDNRKHLRGWLNRVKDISEYI